MAAISIRTLDQVEALVGTEIGVSDWQELDQRAVDEFADVTGDHQWIHVDPERAAASDFGGTIVHGLFTLSLGSRWEEEIIEYSGFEYALNYGYDKVRFPAPMPVGRACVCGCRSRASGPTVAACSYVRDSCSRPRARRSPCAWPTRSPGCRPRTATPGSPGYTPHPNGISSGRRSPARRACIATALWTIRAAVPG
jgi:hypothetical protein